jgi:hypothetical protein
VLLLRDENLVPSQIPDGYHIRILKQEVFSLSFSVFGDSTPINQNSKYFVGICRAYDCGQGATKPGKIRRQANARKGNHTFIVQVAKLAASTIANGAKKSMGFRSAPFGFVMSVTSHSACQLATMAVEIALLYMSGIVGQQNHLI